ncbi:DNA mismatch repair protein MutH [Pelagibacteraceae bacterium]|nr:DNA mismatch repair protein MutH [Pelagibacteraceae bacterium]
MLLNEAYRKLVNLKGKTVGDIFTKSQSHIKELKINKGGVGQRLLLYLGLPLDNKLTDFDDGELKTNKTDESGKSKESIFITQISTIIDELICETPKDFYSSNLFKKIKNVVIVGICKDNDDPNKWKFTYCYNFSYVKNKELFEQFKSDYNSICNQLKKHIQNSNDGFIHTSNGEYIQIRSKDTKPYHPIYSKHMKKNISSKNHAFYFKARFTKHLREL